MSDQIIMDTHLTKLNRGNNSMEKYSRAVLFATIVHGSQQRKIGNMPFITQPIGVANYAINCGVIDIDVIIACVLHDVVNYENNSSYQLYEETSVTIDDIERYFGKRVGDIIREVSDDKSLSEVERKRKQIESIQSMSKEAITVKACDMLYNLKDLIAFPIWNLEKIRGYFIWKYLIYFEMIGTLDHAIEMELQKVFESKITMDGVEYLVIPDKYKSNPNKYVEKYFTLLEQKSNKTSHCCIE